MSYRPNVFPRKLVRWFGGVVLAAAANASFAVTLFQQPPLNEGDAYYANPNFGQQLADNFTLPFAVNVASISWWGGYDGNVDAGNDSFTVRVYSDLTGSGSIVEAFAAGSVTATDGAGLLDAAGNTMYRYDYTLPTALSLNADTTYFLFVENGGTSDWAWLASGEGTGGLFFRGDDSSPAWEPFPANLAFSLDGDRQAQPVPEPPALALLGLAGMALLLARRRWA